MSFLLALLALVFAVVALSRSGKLRDRVRQLSNQVMVMERLLDKAVKTSSAVPAGGTQDAPAAAPAAAPPMAAPPPVKPAAPAIAMPEPVAPAATPPIVAPVPPPVTPVPPAMAPGPAPIVPAPSSPPPPLHAPAAPDPVIASAGARPGAESWETIIGGSWLNRIGIAMLVLGIAFALGYTLTQVGPLGKSLIAIATSLVMIAGGVLLERREAYAFYARGIIGGGWAILYATAYAIHELPATRIVESRLAGFAILLAVGVGMILHSLRYANEGLTTLAYGLGYAAIVLHSISPYTLAAATLLGLGTMIHLIRRRWYGAALGGIAATYGSLLVWYLRQEAPTPQTLRLGLTALAIDWLVFLAPDFTTHPGDDVQRNLSRLVSLLNAAVAGGMALHVMTTVLPDRAWMAPAAFGALYVLTSAALRRLDRQVVHQMHSVAAVVFVAIAAGKALSVTSATWIWLAEAQAVVLIGFGLKDRFHRWLGSILFLLPASAILLEQIRLRALRPDGNLDLRRLALNAAACGCFYLTQARLRRAPLALRGTPESEHEATLRRVFSYAAFALIALSLWVQLPQVWVAPAFAILMLLLFEISALWKDQDLRRQAWLAAATAALVVLPFSAASHVTLGRVPARSLALAAVAAAWLLVFFRLSLPTTKVINEDENARPFLSWAAIALAAGAVWLDARPTMVGPLWMILAILLIESGLGLGEIHLRRPGYLLLLGANASLLLSNLMSTSEVAGLSVRTATIVPGIAATYYLWWRLRALGDPAGTGISDMWDERIGRALSYAGAAMVGLYVRFQFGLEGAAMRWALTMVVLFLLAHRLRDADIRIQAYALGIASLVRAIGFDFRQAGPVLGVDGPLVIALVCTGAYIAAALHLRWRAASSRPDRRALALEERLGRNGADVMWLMATGLAALYAWRTQSGTLLIVIWSLEGLAATGAGFALGTRSLRLGGMILLGLSIVMTLVRAFTTFDMMGRIITFLVLGLVLLLVSFGYTRYRRGARNPS